LVLGGPCRLPHHTVLRKARNGSAEPFPSTLDLLGRPIILQKCHSGQLSAWRGCRGRTHDASFRCAKGGGAAGARRGGGGVRVMWFFNQKRADQVAQSISQLIHTLSDGRKNHGPTSPERLLRELATLLSEDTIIRPRGVKLLMATT